MQEQYTRQIRIPEIGEAGQKRLNNSSVLVVGAGGLGTTVLYSLAGAGVGTIGIVDDDVVDITNLNRQFLYDVQNIGDPKATIAQQRIHELNPDIKIIPYAVRFTEENAKMLLEGYDLVVLAVDNLSTRLVVNRACSLRNLPLVDGGIDGFRGYVTATQFNETPCLQCIYGDNGKKGNPTPGSLGAVVAVISSLEANLAILLLLGKPNPLASKSLYYDALNMSFDEIAFKKNKSCKVCGKLG
ncbi:MAG: UBA/THIF-type NAD/FAD-binding protein [Firmicutes bacterium]|nr:UBA/THIF-type NAD/FAD-binding protein [Bacillota bacterium]